MSLDPRRVQAIFWEAVQYPDPADRAVILERECAADAALRHVVARLLEAHDEYDGIVNEPADFPELGHGAAGGTRGRVCTWHRDHSSRRGPRPHHDCAQRTKHHFFPNIMKIRQWIESQMHLFSIWC